MESSLISISARAASTRAIVGGGINSVGSWFKAFEPVSKSQRTKYDGSPSE
jgi:hypothetical protein